MFVKILMEILAWVREGKSCVNESQLLEQPPGFIPLVNTFICDSMHQASIATLMARITNMIVSTYFYAEKPVLLVYISVSPAYSPSMESRKSLKYQAQEPHQ